MSDFFIAHNQRVFIQLSMILSRNQTIGGWKNGKNGLRFGIQPQNGTPGPRIRFLSSPPAALSVLGRKRGHPTNGSSRERPKLRSSVPRTDRGPECGDANCLARKNGRSFVED